MLREGKDLKQILSSEKDFMIAGELQHGEAAIDNSHVY